MKRSEKIRFAVRRLFFPLSFFYIECVVKAFMSERFFDKNLFYIFLFSFSAGILCDILCSISKNEKFNRILGTVLLAVTTLFIGIQFFCRRTFGVYFSFSIMAMTGADAATDFSQTVVKIIISGIPLILLIVMPTILLIIFGRKIGFFGKMKLMPMMYLIAAMLLFHCTAFGIIMSSKSGIVTDRGFYTDRYEIVSASDRFGLITGMRLDIQHSLFGGLYDNDMSENGIGDIVIVTESTTEAYSDAVTESVTEIDTVSETEPVPIEYGYNVMDIDFEALKAGTNDKTLLSMHEYFAAQEPTRQNEYTGLFKGKNLIYITAESFSPYFISEDLTPTLWMLTHSGFVFTDYYQPAWGVSTSDGEYSGLMGLVPESGLNSMYRSSRNNMYFTFGNQFRRLGYTTLAYHNHTSTYYRRNESHPNLGYDFYAVGTGVEKYTENLWPRSDYEMIVGSMPDYVNKDHFHVYYMSVSGHGGYGKYGNSMSNRNWDAVKDLPYSDKVKAYIAANLEFEKALTALIEGLETAGRLDDTVIAFTDDHYPYGLDKGFEDNEVDYLGELAGRTLERNFEIYKNTLVIWCSDMEKTVTVDKPCYSLDILPTISNLFGLEYDSRLFAGRDILSDSEGLVLFRNYSWISEYGRYNAVTNTFTAVPGASVSADYVKEICSIVKDKVKFSTLILERDYYRLLFEK